MASAKNISFFFFLATLLFALSAPQAKAGVVGIVTYSLCQSGCNTAYVACVGAAGFTAGTFTLGIGAPAALIACSCAQGACMAACAAMALAPTP
ncbi:hypothetical protein HK102_014195 [Quaeritorhiza haematococci]|nr:hypothetical protein HK102_014195 [Quaeritorhiza haematococci]